MLFLGPLRWPSLYILSISHVNAADLHVDLLLSELQNSQKMSYSLKYQDPLPLDFASFTGSVTLRVQELNFFALGK